MKNRRSAITYILFLSVIAIMVAIFLLSAQSAEESGRLSGSLVDRMIAVFYPQYHTLSLEEQLSFYGAISHFVRKVSHFSEYALLGFLLILYFRSRTFSSPKSRRKLLLLSFLISVLYASGDEIHQFFVSGRGPEITDVLIDSAGAAAGIFLGKIFPAFQKSKTDL